MWERLIKRETAMKEKSKVVRKEQSNSRKHLGAQSLQENN